MRINLTRYFDGILWPGTRECGVEWVIGTFLKGEFLNYTLKTEAIGQHCIPSKLFFTYSVKITLCSSITLRKLISAYLILPKAVLMLTPVISAISLKLI